MRGIVAAANSALAAPTPAESLDMSHVELPSIDLSWCAVDHSDG